MNSVELRHRLLVGIVISGRRQLALADVHDEENGIEPAADHLREIDLVAEVLGVIPLLREVVRTDVGVRVERDVGARFGGPGPVPGQRHRVHRGGRADAVDVVSGVVERPLQRLPTPLTDPCAVHQEDGAGRRLRRRRHLPVRLQRRLVR